MFRALPGAKSPGDESTVTRPAGNGCGMISTRWPWNTARPGWQCPARTDVCPAMSGRDFELWQPALGAGLVAGISRAWPAAGPNAQEHAAAAILAGADEQVGDADEAVAPHPGREAGPAGNTPKAGEILEALRGGRINDVCKVDSPRCCCRPTA